MILKMDTYLIFAINGVSSADTSSSTWGTVASPVRTLLPIRAISGHVAGVAADTANDVGSEILLFGTIIFAVTDLPTVLACLVFVVAQSTVECGEFSELVSLELILTLGDGGGLQY